MHTTSGRAQPTFLTADANEAELRLDTDDSGVIEPDATGPNPTALPEHGSTLEQYDASVNVTNWVPLAESVSAFTLTHRDCNQTVLVTPVATLNSIGSPTSNSA
jgi:hypothetical protein